MLSAPLINAQTGAFQLIGGYTGVLWRNRHVIQNAIDRGSLGFTKHCSTCLPHLPACSRFVQYWRARRRERQRLISCFSALNVLIMYFPSNRVLARPRQAGEGARKEAAGPC